MDAPAGSEETRDVRVSQKQQRSKTSPLGSFGCVCLLFQPMICFFQWSSPAGLTTSCSSPGISQSPMGLWERLGDWELSALKAGRLMMFMASSRAPFSLQRTPACSASLQH